MRFDTSKGRAALDGTSIVLAATGLLLWLREPNVPRVTLPAVASRHAVSSVAQSQSGLNVDAATIVTSNIFAATRTPPAARYTPPGAGGSPDVGSGSAMQDQLPAAPVSPPRVYGTMTGPDGATALIQIDSAGASGRLYREGDRVGVFRIERILAGSVVVRGPLGRLELKVEQREDRRE